jgi:hypothetical protein
VIMLNRFYGRSGVRADGLECEINHKYNMFMLYFILHTMLYYARASAIPRMHGH